MAARVFHNLFLAGRHEFAREQLLARQALHGGVLVVHVRAGLVLRWRAQGVRFVQVVHVHPLRQRCDEAKSGSRPPRLRAGRAWLDKLRVQITS